jgi:heme oxygenase
MNSGTGIMDHLRDATRGLHKEAESRPLQRAMARGTLPRASYVMYLAQLRHLHAALEAALEAALDRPGASRAGLSELFTDDRRRVPDLDRDLASFDVDPADVPPLAPTQQFIERIGALLDEDPLALLGPLYVLEGSTNGGRFLARVLERSLRLDGGTGLSYMDPYGDRQPEMWSSFKQLADAVPLTPAQVDAVTESAGRTFTAIAEISDAIVPREESGPLEAD